MPVVTAVSWDIDTETFGHVLVGVASMYYVHSDKHFNFDNRLYERMDSVVPDPEVVIKMGGAAFGLHVHDGSATLRPITFRRRQPYLGDPIVVCPADASAEVLGSSVLKVIRT